MKNENRFTWPIHDNFFIAKLAVVFLFSLAIFSTSSYAKTEKSEEEKFSRNMPSIRVIPWRRIISRV